MTVKRIRTNRDIHLNVMDIDKLLAEMSALQRQVEQTRTEMAEIIMKAKEQANIKVCEPQKRLNQIEKQIKTFVMANRNLFQVQKTKKLNYGEIGLRKSPGALKYVTGWTKDKVLEHFEHKRLMKKYVKMKKDVDRVLLLTDIRANVISRKQAEHCGIRLEEREEAFVKVYSEEIVFVEDAT